MGGSAWRPPRGVLAGLVAAAREDCEARRRARPGLPGEVARSRRRPLGFDAALRDPARPGFPLIAEVKRASPSQGAIRTGADAGAQARAYASAGARCVSVLTEARRFAGSLDDLRRAREAVEVPLLRKDFVVDPYMVFEAAEAGADAVLLIAAAVPPGALADLLACARALGLDALVELASERDLGALEGLHAPLVGINARDLETLEVDPERFGRIAPRAAAPGRLLVAESGVATPADVRRLSAQGAGAALVGEALMRAADPAALARALAGALG